MTQVITWELNFPLTTSIVSGVGSVQRLRERVDHIGASRALVVTGPTLLNKTNLVEEVKSALGDKCAGVFSGVVQHVPRECVFEGARLARRVDADILVSLGGTSCSDAAKGINIVLSEGEQLDAFAIKYELSKPVVIPQLNKPKLPLITIPTTLSGGEITGGLGITNRKLGRKEGFRNPKLSPKVIILDPKMTAFTGRELWASTGLKAMSDCFEGVCSLRHQPFVDALSLHAAQIINRNLTRSVVEPLDLEARGLLQHAAWMSMYGRQSTGGGVTSALRHQIGALYNVAHGVASSIVFPHCSRFTRPVVEDRLALVAKALDLPVTNIGDAATAAINRIDELIRELGLPNRLRDVGVPREGIKRIAEASIQDHILKDNPKPIASVEQLLSILEEAW